MAYDIRIITYPVTVNLAGYTTAERDADQEKIIKRIEKLRNQGYQIVGVTPNNTSHGSYVTYTLEKDISK